MIQLHPPDSQIAHIVPRICHLHHARVRSLLGALGLHRGQPFMLAVLWEQEGYSHSELAEHLDVTPATITKMLQRMEQAGFVTRQPDPYDQRISRVYLTERGRSVRKQVDDVFRTMDRDMLVGFDESERDLLLGFLTRMRANLERAASEAASTGTAETGADDETQPIPIDEAAH